MRGFALRLCLRRKVVLLQADVQTDRTITMNLVAAKIALADAEYEKLNMQLALQVERNRNRVLAAKLTNLAVERDLYVAHHT